MASSANLVQLSPLIMQCIKTCKLKLLLKLRQWIAFKYAEVMAYYTAVNYYKKFIYLAYCRNVSNFLYQFYIFIYFVYQIVCTNNLHLQFNNKLTFSENLEIQSGRFYPRSEKSTPVVRNIFCWVLDGGCVYLGHVLCM